MDRESWTQLNRLLDEALDLLPEDREGWFDSLGPDNEPVKARLRALLAHRSSIHASGFLESVPSLTALSVSTSGFNTRMLQASPDDDREGAVVGAYRLLRCIGGGGMGTVWLAERADGLLRREVALKLPRAAWLRADLVARMERERDILSTLEHPNIARLYDAGVTAAGRPYLALEYVNGRSIDEYCATGALDVRARVCLFLQVVEAVVYAHGRLVVHRDLKPSNILVTHEGRVRLLDFGIAKLLDDGDDRRSGETDFGTPPHTPEYASPEQISGAPLGTASDVYSLGVVLYEHAEQPRPS